MPAQIQADHLLDLERADAISTAARAQILAAFTAGQGGPSLPLDVGYRDTVPAAIRHAVLLRDRHCQWAGGCRQPAAACQVHHVRHRADGGPTSVTGCVLLCFFHHQVVIHRWGWTLVLNPDGTTTAWNRDRTKVLHSHGPRPEPGNPPDGPGHLMAPDPTSATPVRKSAGSLIAPAYSQPVPAM
jgi:5-methylcytosine-specific restriction endonuclease McrA